MFGANWGATATECVTEQPCDALFPDGLSVDRAISIAAPPATVFGWFCQLRVAPYSYDLLDNWGKSSPRERDRALADLAVGQRFMNLFTLQSYVADRHITLRTPSVSVTYAVAPEAAGSRVHVRVRFGGPRLVGHLIAIGDLVMMRKQLLTLKELAEGEHSAQRIG